MVVEWADLVVLNGKREGDPGGSKGRDATVDASALVEVEAEHDELWWKKVMLSKEKYLGK